MAVSRAQIADQVIKKHIAYVVFRADIFVQGRTERPSQREMHDDAWSSSGIGGAKFDRSHARKTPCRSGHSRQADLSPYRRDGVVRESQKLCMTREEWARQREASRDLAQRAVSDGSGRAGGN